jgi:hypothetical protein
MAMKKKREIDEGPQGQGSMTPGNIGAGKMFSWQRIFWFPKLRRSKIDFALWGAVELKEIFLFPYF